MQILLVYNLNLKWSFKEYYCSRQVWRNIIKPSSQLKHKVLVKNIFICLFIYNVSHKEIEGETVLRETLSVSTTLFTKKERSSIKQNNIYYDDS